MTDAMRVLVIDDEPPAREELAWLLGAHPKVAAVRSAGDALEALRLLDEEPVDAVFCDISMPGLDGIELARVLNRFAAPPPVVFVTAHEQHAIAAFEVRAADYLLKPVDAARLSRTLDRLLDHPVAGPIRAPAESAEPAPEPHAATRPAVAEDDETIPVEQAGRTKFVRRLDIAYVEASGDYSRLHLVDGGSHLVRIPLSTLEERWSGAGFLRVHRSRLVALRHVTEVRLDASECSVRIAGVDLPVSRRHRRELRERLLRGGPGGRR